ncbi:hypothetical protein PLUTO_00130 [Luteibacter phage vB_LflM-Pluto]|uniref:Tail sheath protein n=1 Tax=Luteibacter phage vB_LflM-Pluto TaxID=2948611 RepID=A0A9E7SM74_9CAUD|nr:hypothetical protein PLUTO_00130 [Luteibacter phage vB_LflM-Pluto]
MISQSRYINIISGVGAGAAVAQRQLILRCMTQSTLLPPGIVAEFSTVDSVGSIFGTQSEEYKRAKAYLGFISKQVKRPQKISFARWVATAIAPMVVGDTTVKSLGALAAITTGELAIAVNGVAVPLSGVDLSTAETLTDVASLLQTAIRALANPQLTGATVTFNTNTNQFVLTGTVTGSGTITVSPTETADDLSQLLGLATTGTVNVTGQAADTPEDAVAKSAAISDNFGSFLFCTPSAPLQNAEIAAIASWNHAQNNKFMYTVATPITNIGALFGLCKGYSGFAINIIDPTKPNDFIEQSPAEILGATDYTQPGATQNYMFYQFGARNVTVNDDPTADVADANRANYIGATQSAGQQLAFYQRGLLCGDSTAAVDMNTYANEMWLKSDIAVTLLRFFLSVPRVPANESGEASLTAILQPVFDLAKTNGTFSAGKTLDATQQEYITTITGDPTAWRQVATIGWWFTIKIESYVNDNTNLTEWKANYTLVYSKDDAIRAVDGSDILI